MRLRAPLSFLLTAIALGAATSASASDGRIEINQASVEAEGGFPYTISQPGSYVLTGSLTVPADTTGIIIGTSNVTLDLNGFMITGPYVCEPGNCPGGSADGISTNGQQNSYVTVRNGIVSGFSDRCIQLFQHARVERMQISQCGRDGINLSAYGSVYFNQVFHVGDTGIFMAGDSGVLGHNSVSEASVGAGVDPAIRGGKQTAGNFCDDGDCGWLDTRRRFYLSEGEHQGDTARFACVPGFHMASLWEILDVTQLRYDLNNGRTAEDSGFGPPTVEKGWIRTGKPDFVVVTTPGGVSCAGYTTTSGTGTAIFLPQIWDSDYPSTINLRAPWWYGEEIACTADLAVWCVEN